MLFVFIYEYWFVIRIPYHMVLMSFNSNTNAVISGEGIANLTLLEHMGFPPVFIGV
jgi:hypothetical protein